MKYKIGILSLAMAAIVLLAMGATAGVSAAKPATVGAPACGVCGGPFLLWDPSVVPGYWHITQGAPTPSGLNIYYQNFLTGTVWHALGTGTNPSALAVPGATPSVIIMARGTDGAIWAKSTTDGTTWSNVALPTITAAACTGPLAVYNPDANQIDVFYVNSGNNQLMEDSLNLATATNTQTPLGGRVLATPAAAWTPNTAGMAVVVKGTGGVIYEKIYAAGSWGGWTKFHDGTIGAGASLALDPGTNNLYLFVAGQDTHMYALQSINNGLTWRVPNPILRPGVLGWANLGGVLTSAPSASGGQYGVAGPAFVIARGGDCRIYEFCVTLGSTCTGRWNCPVPPAPGP